MCIRDSFKIVLEIASNFLEFNYLFSFIVDNRKSIETITLDESYQEIACINNILTQLVETRSNDLNLLKGISKFKDRLAKYQNQPSKLASAFHCFGVTTNYRKVTNCTLSKKGRGKISVQPEAVKRRKKKNGSRTAIVKGMTKKTNPFENRASNRKRSHNISQNISKNEPVSKKAGRTMSSKTKMLTKIPIAEAKKE